MDQYVVGLDGGGTKTAVTVCGVEGDVLQRFTAGAINYNGESDESVELNLNRIFDTLEKFRGLENCRSVCIGAAGISNPEVTLKMERQVRRCGYHAGLLVTGDHRTALYGALGKAEGIILISGTGSICYGRNGRGEERRSGGFGYLIDDEGSGYAIGRDILSAVVRAFDGRGRPTALGRLLARELHTDKIEDMVRFVYDKNTQKRHIAALAKLLPEAAAQGDEAARNIVRHCAEELFALVVPVAEKLGLAEGKLALAGSILQKDENIRGAFLERLNPAYPLLECVAPRDDASAGAAKMALEAIR